LNMTENELRSINTIPSGMQVKQGSTLLVARQGALDSDVTEHLADNAQISFAPEIVLKRIMVKVQKGDTLLSLATRHDVTPNNIAAWNKLKMPALLKPGQSIAILVPTTSSSKGSKSVKGSGKKANNAVVNSRKQEKTSNSSSAKSKSAVQAKGPHKPKTQP
jgi:membrane-bound lytic murein transglycosylase D